MQLAATQQVLLAIYSETQKENPNVCSSVTPKKLGMSSLNFRVAIDKLESQGFIYGSLIIVGDCCPIPRMVLIDNVKLTQFGMECVERIQQILKDIPYQALSGEDILQPWLTQVTAKVKEACSIEHHHKAC